MAQNLTTIPADIVGWQSSEGDSLVAKPDFGNSSRNHVSLVCKVIKYFQGSMFINQIFLVVQMTYNTRVEAEDVILGNDVILQCEMPSFSADFLSVAAWVDSTGLVFNPHRYGNWAAAGSISCFSSSSLF